MQNLHPNLILQRAIDIEIVINSNNIENFDEKTIKSIAKKFALTILDIFFAPDFQCPPH